MATKPGGIHMRFRSIDAARLFAAIVATVSIGRVSAAELPAASANPSDLPAAGPQLEELVVTATRTSELLSRVPVSMSAFSQDRLDTLGVKTIADVANLTPGVTFTSRKAIAIRGVVSNAGAGTTGVYVDDTPIQIYTVGAFATDAVPAIFDLDRIEVLRGPQGTLFGSGSMGGTVRYITPQPSLSDYSFRARAESSYSDQVNPSYEGGLAVGGPIMKDVLGFRASAFYRRDGGWIDRVDRTTGAIVDRDANWGESYALRLATTWAPREGIEITPAIYHQYRYQNAGQGFPINTGDGNSASWESFSNPGAGIFRNGSRIETPGQDRSTLSSMTMKFHLGAATLIANTSYYDREGSNLADSSTFDASLFGFTTPTGTAVPGVPDWNSYDVIHNRQRSFVQEIRIQSGQQQRLRWVAGVYYDNNDQYNLEEFHAPSLPLLVQNAFGATMVDVFGEELLTPDIGFFGELKSKNSQVAGFGEANLDLTDTVTVTAGLRKSRPKYSFHGTNDGPYNGGRSISSGSTSDSPWTPKAGVDFKPTDTTMFYLTAAKGFRTGGANTPIAAGRCDADLAALGLTTPPQTYRSDAVWSYEIGAKSKLFDQRLQLSSSVFNINWSDIQQRVYLPTCGFYIVSNLGEARSRGFDLQMQGLVTDWIKLGLNVGYNDARFSKTVAQGPSNLVTDGDYLPISPWSGTVSGDIDFHVAALPAYLHAEYVVASSYPSTLVTRNPENSSYDPDYYRRPSTRLAYLRAGVRVGEFDISLFANNLFNADTTIGRSNDNLGSPLFVINNLQPRVFGITVAYRSE
jgi:iron complex outermembrane receptor protein